MLGLVNKFETIVILKTMVFDVNLNFLDLEDLYKIENYAYDLGIELPINIKDEEGFPINSLDDLYNSQYDIIEDIYNDWKEIVYNEYIETKNGLLKLI